MNTGEQCLDPSPKCRVARGHMGQRRTRPVDQQFAQVYVTALADAEKFRLATGRCLTRDKSKPCCKIAPALECLRLPDRRNQRRSDRYANARNRRQSPRVLVLLRESRKLFIKDRDPPIKFSPLGP